jgi:toxin ParE1/3/4
MPSPRYHHQARVDLESLWLYIARENISAADRYVDGLEAAAQRYAATPGMGRLEPDLADRLDVPPGITLRSFLYRNHRSYYIPEDTGIFILRILDTRRDIENLLGNGEDA